MNQSHDITSDTHSLLSTFSQSSLRILLLSGFLKKRFVGPSVEIDLFVRHEDKIRFEQLIGVAGFRKLQNPPKAVDHTFYRKFDGPNVFTLDVQYDIAFFSAPYNLWIPLQKAELEAGGNWIESFAGVYRPSSFDCILLYAANCAWLKGDKIKEHHKRNLLAYIKAFKSDLLPEQKTVSDVLYRTITQADTKNLSKRIRSVIRPYFKRHFSLFSMRRWIQRRVRFGLGMKVLFLGTDGAGKSTLVSTLKSRLAHPTNALYMGMGESGWKVPFNKTLIRALSRTPFKFIAKWFLQPIEYMCRLGIAALSGRHKVLLIDRFPEYQRFRNPLRKLLFKCFLPKPDIVIFLHGNPERITNRKNEDIVLENTVSNTFKFRIMAYQYGAEDVLELNTTELTIDQCVNQIRQTIFASSALRTKMYTKELNEFGSK